MIPNFRAYDGGSLSRMYQPEDVMVGGGNIWINDEDFDAGEWIVNNDLELMQSTGLFDKNGKEIFEGDILCDEGLEQEDEFVYVTVSYREGMWVCDQITDELCGYGGALNEFSNDYSIIGNIYENPELLEVEE